MAIGTLYISHKDYDFSTLDSKWLTKRNLDKSISSTDVEDYHTSLEDSRVKNYDDIRFILNNIQSIEFLNIETYLNSKKNKNPILFFLCGILINEYKNLCKPGQIGVIFRYWFETSLQVRANKNSSNKSLWVAGCSISYGTGVDEDQKWGRLVANHFNLEEVNLAIGGGSINDTTDQIIRANIQKDDIVVWGLTSLNRIDLIVNGQIQSWTASMALDLEITHQYFNIDYFDSNSLKFNAIKSIYQVIAHCEKIGAKLYLVNFLDNEWTPMAFANKKNFLNLFLTEDFLDLGTDGAHPGPLQHQKYAKEIIKFIERA